MSFRPFLSLVFFESCAIILFSKKAQPLCAAMCTAAAAVQCNAYYYLIVPYLIDYLQKIKESIFLQDNIVQRFNLLCRNAHQITIAKKNSLLAIF